SESLVQTEEQSDLASSDPDITSRNICIRSNMSKQFRHQSLAETHHLEVAFSFRVEIGSAFGPAHWQSSKRVLEYLFEGKKFEDAKIDRRMKPHSALIRADCAVHLNSESAIDVKVSLIIAPRHPKHDHPFWLDNSLENL